MRSDEVAGCLRTARGGSSKQALVRVEGGKVNVRWMTSREYARLMGAPEYNLEGLRDNQVLFGFGDAVVVDVVKWLGEHYLMPLIKRHEAANDPAADDIEDARVAVHA
jgi:DNA (cytosine-5)-methyltransferase 1